VSVTEARTPGRGEPQVQRLPMLRRAMVRAMLEAVTVPCFYLRVTATVADLVARRSALRKAGGEGVPSVNDLIIKAVALSLRDHPEVNASYVDGTVERYPRINVGVAIAVEGGLVVPAVYDADRKGAAAIGAEVRELVELAQRRRLTREVLQDPTFTVSNLGMYGIEDFDPLINTPQAAILGVGSASEAGLLRLTLGCDHRVLTGAEGALFLKTLRGRLESPDELFAEATR
jgi:pyruvate dehydrogenase E2 component (dihydrolipoamide acetyltransferase)